MLNWLFFDVGGQPKERDDILDWWRGESFHDVGGKEEAAVWCYLHLI